MERDEAISRCRNAISGLGLDRSSFPEGGKGEIAKACWNEGLFGLGMEYGYILAMIEAFELTFEEVWDDQCSQ